MSGQQGSNNPRRLRVLRAYKRNPKGTIRELARAAELSETATYYHLCNLQNEGVITRSDKRRGRKASQPKREKQTTVFGQRKWVVPEKKTVGADHFSKCFEQAVALGKANDAKKDNAWDVVRHNRSPLLFSQMKAVKIG